MPGWAFASFDASTVVIQFCLVTVIFVPMAVTRALFKRVLQALVDMLEFLDRLLAEPLVLLLSLLVGDSTFFKRVPADRFGVFRIAHVAR